MYVVATSGAMYTFDTEDEALAWQNVYGAYDSAIHYAEHNPTVEPGVQPLFSCLAWAIDDEESLVVTKFGRDLADTREFAYWDEPTEFDESTWCFRIHIEAADEDEARRKVIAKMRSYSDFEQRKAECEASEDYAYMRDINAGMREQNKARREREEVRA